MNEIDRKKKQLAFGKVNKDDLIMIPFWGTVNNVNKTNKELNVNTVGSNSFNFDVKGEHLVNRCYSADHFTSEVKVTKTQAAELLSTSYNIPFTVNFDKTDGSNRTLRGRLIEPETLMGRSKVEDLDASGNPFRLVDHRSIKWIIVNCTKYVVKK